MDKPQTNWKRQLMIAAVATIITASVMPIIVQEASGHGIQIQLQSRFVRINDETFSRESMHTGEEIEIKGRLESLVNRDLRAWISVFAESTNAGNRWEFVSRDPPGNVFDIPPHGEVPYTLKVKALEAGTYHMHTQLNIASVGPALGPGQTVFVEGQPIIKPISVGNVIYQTMLIAAGLAVSFVTKPWQVI
ncbi:MAG: methane monooxygenase/ammonia monooxygenase subunit B [Nitrososphaerales archaeon]